MEKRNSLGQHHIGNNGTPGPDLVPTPKPLLFPRLTHCFSALFWGDTWILPSGNAHVCTHTQSSLGAHKEKACSTSVLWAVGRRPRLPPGKAGGRHALYGTGTAASRYLPTLNRGEAGSLDPCGVVEQPHVAQHHHRTEQQGRGVGHVLAGDVRGCAVNLPQGNAAQSGDTGHAALFWEPHPWRTVTEQRLHPTPQTQV